MEPVVNDERGGDRSHGRGQKRHRALQPADLRLLGEPVRGLRARVSLLLRELLPAEAATGGKRSAVSSALPGVSYEDLTACICWCVTIGSATCCGKA